MGMEQEISLIDLIAAAVRKGTKIIIFALIIGLIVTVGSAFLDSLGSGKEKDPNILNSTERQIRDLEKTIERAENGIAAEREYIGKSLYMQLNPYDISSTTINYTVSDLDVPLDGSLGMMQNPTEYALNRVIGQYGQAWAGTDLSDAPVLFDYGLEDRFLREVIFINNTENGNITIEAYAASEEESKKLASAAEAVLRSLQNTAATESFGHKLTHTSTVTKQVIDEAIRDAQNAHYDAIDTYTDDLSSATKTLRDMQEDPVTQMIKKFIIGCIAGGILAFLWSMFRAMVRSSAESAEQICAQTGLNDLGSAVSGKGGSVFARLASAITGEKKWDSDAEALSYMAERASIECDGPVLVTTVDKGAGTPGVEALIAALQAKGIDASFLPGIGLNAETLSALKDAGSVIFAVTKGRTNIPDLLAAKTVAEQAGKTAAGFVML